MKTEKILAILVLALGLIVCLANVSEAAPMGSAFTYQGHLYDANHVANGEYDFQFKLYDANVAGGQAGSDVNKPDVDVIDAYFTVELDFGGVFDGNERWLEIGVRPGELEDPCEYTALQPRQEVTPTPYAIYAQNADRVDDYHYSSTWPTTLANIQSACSNNFHNIGGTDDDAPDSDGEVPDNISINNGLLYAPSGSSSVGIGTTSPQSAVKLEVRSSVSGGVAVAGYGAGDDNIAIFGMSSSNGVAAIQGNANGADYAGYFSGNVVVTGGNVGIGTISPGAKLEVNGPIKITDGSQGAGKVLTSDASGLASWQTPAAGSGTHYWSCVGANFHPQYNDTSNTEIKRDPAYIEAEADGIFFFAPVMLPDGASITKVVVYGNATAEDWSFRRITLNSATMNVVESAKIGTEVTLSTPHTIDNNANAYVLWTSSLDTGGRIYNARITYTF